MVRRYAGSKKGKTWKMGVSKGRAGGVTYGKKKKR